MARLTTITSKDQVAAEHHPIVDAIVKSRGGVQGPFKMFMHCPPLAERVMQLGAYVRFEGKLDKRVRVLAAMTAARDFDAVYVWGRSRAKRAAWACRRQPSPRSVRNTRAAFQRRTRRSWNSRAISCGNTAWMLRA
jgi:hypothetical protein